MEKILDVLQVLNNLNSLKRMGPNLFAGIPTYALESIAEHSYKVTYLCLIFGKLDNVRLDKLLTFAITHDWSESIIGNSIATSNSYKSYFNVNIKEIVKAAEGKAKEVLLSDSKVGMVEINEDERQVFKFCDILAVVLELIDSKQKGFKHGWLDKMYKVQISRLSKFKFPFVPELIFDLEKIYQRGYMENPYLTKATEDIWKDKKNPDIL